MTTVRERRADRLIKKHLEWRGLKLRTSRSNGEKSNLGDLYILDSYQNTVIFSHQNRDGMRVEAEATEDMLEKMNLYGRKRAAGEQLAFKLSREDLFIILQDHIRENLEYLTPESIRHYERLLFGAVVWCNREIVEGNAEDVYDALPKIQEARLKIKEAQSTSSRLAA
jgi:hypothetical protein